MKRESLLSSLKPWLAPLMLAVAMVFGVVPTVSANDQRHNDEIRLAMAQSPSIRTGFPRLRDNFEVLADATPRYNCIAYSLGIYDHWVNPETGSADAPLAPMNRMYAAKGYERRADLNWQSQSGVEKVVLYATLKPDGTLKEVTHAARQDRDGTFTSKLGQLPVIRHATPEDLRGPTYGLPVAVYARPAYASNP